MCAQCSGEEGTPDQGKSVRSGSPAHSPASTHRQEGPTALAHLPSVFLSLSGPQTSLRWECGTHWIKCVKRTAVCLINSSNYYSSANT